MDWAPNPQTGWADSSTAASCMAKESAQDLQEWAQADLKWSQRRRSRAKGERRLENALLLAAVLGLIAIFKYVTLSSPGQHWYIGLVGILLMVPYLTRRLS
jgi:Flp pilus assembly protein TadB